MPSATSLTRVSMFMRLRPPAFCCVCVLTFGLTGLRSAPGSERHLLGEQAGARGTARKDPAELDRVEGDLLAGVALRERSARGPGELEAEGPAVAPSPLGHDVGDEAAVVFGSEPERT